MPQSQIRSDDEIAAAIMHKVLDRIPFSFGINIDKNWLDTLTVQQFIDAVSREIAIKINFELPGFTREQSLFSPKTVWQMFKRDYFPQWLINRFPIQYDEYPIIVANYVLPYNSFGEKVKI